MSANPERVVVITLPGVLASDFDRLLSEYADLLDAEIEECRAGAELIIAEAGLRAFNLAVMENRKLAERMGWR